MGKIVRALSADGSALCSAVDTTDIVNEIHRIHGTSATASAAAGRLATAACIMGALMKNETDRLELRINGGGKIGTITTVADYRGNVKCCMDNPFADLPLNSKGKLDVGGIVGTDGYTYSERRNSYRCNAVLCGKRADTYCLCTGRTC